MLSKLPTAYFTEDMESVSREGLCGVLMALQRFWPSVSLLPRWGVSSSFSTPNAHTPPVILFLPACPGACPTPTVPHLASSRYSLCHLVRPRAVDTAMCYSASFSGRKGSSPAAGSAAGRWPSVQSCLSRRKSSHWRSHSLLRAAFLCWLVHVRDT